MILMIQKHDSLRLRPRSNKTHVSSEDVKQLGEFIHACPPQELAKASHPGIIPQLVHGFGKGTQVNHSGEHVLRFLDHGPELIHGERFSSQVPQSPLMGGRLRPIPIPRLPTVKTNPLLLEDGWTIRIHSDEEKDESHHRGREEDQKHGKNDVHDPLCHNELTVLRR